MRVTVSATGAATPDVVWDRYVRPARWPTWSPYIRRVDCTDEVLQAGTTGQVHGPTGLVGDFRVLVVEPAERTWSWRVRIRHLKMQLDLLHDVQQVPEGGTSSTLRIDGLVPVALSYAPIAQWSLTQLVRP
ncbi:SRPBCC family protein [Rhodococcus sp. X156]|uniref:SRPBCC family protein n=1 Tax=Rhodococcus sp. X156 TaxID=2499145 RepID=UPI000FD719CC|nr:SRPBCC family protein [Rhodococcus sp. X156]